MAQGFHRRRDGKIVVGLDPDERRLLTIVFSSLISLLDGDADDSPTDRDEGDGAIPSADQLAAMIGMDSTGEAPDDPALRRLFPDIDPNDQQRSEEFRRYTEAGLRDAKTASLRTVLLTLGRSEPITLADTEAQAWLQALNDMRLVTAVRLGIETEEDWEELLGEDARSEDITVTIYDFLSWLQETLTGVLLADLEADS